MNLATSEQTFQTGNKDENSDVPQWVALVEHEETHGQDYNAQDSYLFIYKYYKIIRIINKQGCITILHIRVLKLKKAFRNEVTLVFF